MGFYVSQWLLHVGRWLIYVSWYSSSSSGGYFLLSAYQCAQHISALIQRINALIQRINALIQRINTLAAHQYAHIRRITTLTTSVSIRS